MTITYSSRVTYSSPEVCHIVGITYRQLDHWCSCGWIPGQAGNNEQGSGRHRRFTVHQIERITWLAKAAAIKALPLDELADQLASQKLRAAS